MKLTYNVEDRPKFLQVIVFALQQLLAILAATIAVPAIIGHGMSQSAALFGAGVGTLVYLLFTKFKSPVFLGSSFAFLGSMGAAFAGAATVELGYVGLLIGAVCAGLVYVIISIIVKLCGSGWVNKIMPAVIIGPTVAIIGLSLAGNAIGDLQKGNVTEPVQNTVTAVYDLSEDNEKVINYEVKYCDENGKEVVKSFDVVDEAGNAVTTDVQKASVYACIFCGLVTLAVTMICSVYGKGMIKMIPFIIGICAGYAVAAIFTLTGVPALQIINFSAFKDMAWLPDFTFVKALGGFKSITGDYIVSVIVAYAPVAFVVFAEHIADHKNLSSIIERDLLAEPGLHRTLLGDGVGSIAGAIFGGCPNTTYGESVGCVAISGNASVVTIFATAVLAIVASFVAPFTTFLATIPSCVMGGVCIALYGFIAVSGLKMIQKVDLDDNSNLFPVSVILICGVGGLSIAFGKVTITTVACSLILGILANVMLKKGRKSEEKKD